jgi:hypothetical protein
MLGIEVLLPISKYAFIIPWVFIRKKEQSLSMKGIDFHIEGGLKHPSIQ